MTQKSGPAVLSTAAGTTTAFQYDGEAVLTERQGGSVTASYAYGNALLRKDGETPLFDGLGSERTVTNSSGASAASLTTDAFGLAVTGSGTTGSAYRFGATSGYRDDGDAGLVKVGCRYYDPETGRFTTRDTDLSQSAYVYCDADPVNKVDPSGHNWLGDTLEGIGLGVVLLSDIIPPWPVIVLTPPYILPITHKQVWAYTGAAIYEAGRWINGEF